MKYLFSKRLDNVKKKYVLCETIAGKAIKDFWRKTPTKTQSEQFALVRFGFFIFKQI